MQSESVQTRCGSALAHLAAFASLLALGCQEQRPPTASASEPALAVTPAAVAFSQLSVGFDHTCALTDAGVAYCWGLSTSGQLGAGTSGNFRNRPVAVAPPAR